jgi:hypothetical protein
MSMIQHKKFNMDTLLNVTYVSWATLDYVRSESSLFGIKMKHVSSKLRRNCFSGKET